MNNYCIYRHIRLDRNTPFYVGKGKGKRPWDMYNRSQRHKNIVNKHGVRVEIIMDNLTEKEAFEKEIYYIGVYKACGFCEANFTDGGEGCSGYKHTVVTLKKLSELSRGLTHNRGRIHSAESKANMSKAHLEQTPWNLGIPCSSETKKILRDQRLGKKQSIETREKRRKTALEHKINKRGNHGNAKKVKCLKTDKIWSCVKDASEELNINYVTMKQYLQKPRKTTKYNQLKTLRYVPSV